MKYVLLIRAECDYCDMAVRLLESESLAYELVDVGRDLLTSHEIKKAFDWQTFPIVLEKTESTLKLVGGYSDLEHYLEHAE